MKICFFIFCSLFAVYSYASFQFSTYDLPIEGYVKESIDKLLDPDRKDPKSEEIRYHHLTQILINTIQHDKHYGLYDGWPLYSTDKAASVYRSTPSILLESLLKIQEKKPYLLNVDGSPESIIASLKNKAETMTSEQRFSLVTEALPYLGTKEGFSFIEFMGDQFLEEGNLTHALDAFEYLRFFSPLFSAQASQKSILEKIDFCDKKIQSAISNLENFDPYDPTFTNSSDRYMIHSRPLKIFNHTYIVASTGQYDLYLLKLDQNRNIVQRQFIATRSYSWLYSTPNFFPYFLSYDRGNVLVETEEFVAVFNPNGHIQHILPYDAEENIALKYHFYEKTFGPEIADKGGNIAAYLNEALPWARFIPNPLVPLYWWVKEDLLGFNNENSLSQNPYIFSYLATFFQRREYPDSSHYADYYFFKIAPYNKPLANAFLLSMLLDPGQHNRHAAIHFFTRHEIYPLQDPKLETKIKSILKMDIGSESLITKVHALWDLSYFKEEKAFIREEIKEVIPYSNQNAFPLTDVLYIIAQLGPMDDPEILAFLLKELEEHPGYASDIVKPLALTGRIHEYIPLLAKTLSCDASSRFEVIYHTEEVRDVLFSELIKIFDDSSDDKIKQNIIKSLAEFNSSQFFETIFDRWDLSSREVRNAMTYSMVEHSQMHAFTVSQIENLWNKLEEEEDDNIENLLTELIYQESLDLSRQDQWRLGLYLNKHYGSKTDLTARGLMVQMGFPNDFK